VDHPVIGRRREPRLPAAALPPIEATLRPGYVVSVVDISRSAAQVETTRPLRPGARVHVRLVLGDDVRAVGAVVLRCAVYAIHAGAGVLYRSALRFEDGGLPFWQPAWNPSAAGGEHS
jgi:hypothetical protein